MKKLLSFIMATTMVLGFSACGSTPVANDGAEGTTEPVSSQETQAEAPVDDNTIVIGIDDEFPPMGFRDENNEIVGFDIELAKAAAKKMGVEVTFQPIDWGTKELELSSGTVDLLWNGLTITDERRENMEFTNPYLENKQIILVKNDSDIKAKADLAGKTIGLQDGSTAVDAVNADEMVSQLGDIVTYDTNLLAFTDLDIARVDAVVVDEVVAKYYLTTNETDFRLLDEDFGDEVYGVAANKGNTELIDKVQTALNELGADGTAAEISNKWFGGDIYVYTK